MTREILPAEKELARISLALMIQELEEQKLENNCWLRPAGCGQVLPV